MKSISITVVIAGLCTFAVAQAPDLSKMDIVLKSVPDGAVAKIGSHVISRDEFVRFYKNELRRIMAESRSNDMPDADRARLAHMIGELRDRSWLERDLPVHISWVKLALGFAASEVFVIHYQFRRERYTFSLMELPLTLGLFFWVWYEQDLQDWQRLDWMFPIRGRWLRRFLLVALGFLLGAEVALPALVLLLWWAWARS